MTNNDAKTLRRRFDLISKTKGSLCFQSSFYP
jgi:hypothetical protein